MRKKNILAVSFLSVVLVMFSHIFVAEAGSPIVSETTLTVDDNVVKINGKAARLVGYGDIGILAESRFAYKPFFESLRSNKINMVRVWVNYHWANSLTPYEGSRRRKYNIENMNDAFYSRLANFVSEASRQGIIVQVCLFDANALETGADDKYHQRWVKFPLNQENNNNKYLSKRSKYFSVNEQCNPNTDECIWSKVHSKLIDRVVATLGNLGNVIYEVMNEPGQSNTGLSRDSKGKLTEASSKAIVDFHKAVISRITSQLKNYSGSKVISVNADISDLKDLVRDTKEASLYSVHLANEEGPSSSELKSTKPVIISNDGHCTQTVSNYDRNNKHRNMKCEGAVNSGADDQRAKRTEALLKTVFPNRDKNDGHTHFDFLDKGINGKSWPTTTNYNPNAGRRDTKVMKKLKDYAF